MQHIPSDNLLDGPLKSLIERVSPYTNLTPEDIKDLEDLELGLTVEYLRIGEAVDKIRADLLRVYGAIDEDSALRRPFNKHDTGSARFTDDEYFARRPKGVLYAHLMTKNGRQRLQEHLAAFEETVIPALREGVNCRFESGGVKSVQSVLDHLLTARTPADRLSEISGVKSVQGVQSVFDHLLTAKTPADRLSEIGKLKDAIRGCIVVANLCDAEQVMGNLHTISAQKNFRVVSLRNSYRNWETAHGGRHHFACNTALAPEEGGNLSPDLPPYELQIMTENAQRVAKLTHPVAINGHIRGRVRLPPVLENHMIGLALGAAVTDGREYFSRKARA